MLENRHRVPRSSATAAAVLFILSACGGATESDAPTTGTDGCLVSPCDGDGGRPDPDGGSTAEDAGGEIVSPDAGPEPRPGPSPEEDLLACDGLCVLPGARGFGVGTPAGRGGEVVRVTNLSDSGSGSLRAALDASGPRTIIFDVAGTITLSSALRIRNPYVTVAGQTAPSPGITLRGHGLDIDTHDVLIQHIRVRVGDQSGGDPDGIAIKEDAHHVIIDHVSASWAIDELLSTGVVANSDITISNSIFSEALDDATHPEGPHSKGFLLGEHSHRVAFLFNLMAHNVDRQLAYVKGDTSSVFVNNLSHDPGRSTAFQLGGSGGSSVVASVVGNASRVVGSSDTPMIRINGSASSGSALHIADNDGFEVVNRSGDAVLAAEPAIWPAGLTALPSSEVEAAVLANAGARPADRDAVDMRIVDQVVTRSGRIIDSQEEVGGWPELAPVTRALELPADPSADDDGDGYTNLEHLLHQLSAEVEGR